MGALPAPGAAPAASSCHPLQLAGVVVSIEAASQSTSVTVKREMADSIGIGHAVA
jgi:hypothetical protein